MNTKILTTVSRRDGQGQDFKSDPCCGVPGNAVLTGDFRALFCLPPIKVGSSTQLTPRTPEPQTVVTGDSEVDAVLWLRAVISTGEAHLIDKAMLAAKTIKTPLPALEKRYSKFLMSQNPGQIFASFGSFGFADLEDLAQRAIAKRVLKEEVLARFGDVATLSDDTPAEAFCNEVLAGLRRNKHLSLSDSKVDERFQKYPDLMPASLTDCLYELDYWDRLERLRGAADAGDLSDQASAREWFAFRCLARIAPTSRQEAIAALHYLESSERMDCKETGAILFNLVAGEPLPAARPRRGRVVAGEAITIDGVY